MRKSTSPSLMSDKCSICGHSSERHILIGNGNTFTTGGYLCLTGYCRCGRKRLQKKARTVKMANQSVQPIQPEEASDAD